MAETAGGRRCSRATVRHHGNRFTEEEGNRIWREVRVGASRLTLVVINVVCQNVSQRFIITNVPVPTFLDFRAWQVRAVPTIKVQIQLHLKEFLLEKLNLVNIPNMFNPSTSRRPRRNGRSLWETRRSSQSRTRDRSSGKGGTGP